MTDKTAHEVTNEDRRRARDWAWQVEADPDAWTERLRVAARVILVDIPAPTPPTTAKENPEMPDQTIPADKVREIIARWRDGVSDRGGLILDDLKALLPAPPPPTLADMTPEEQGKHVGGQVDVSAEAFGGRAIPADKVREIVDAMRESMRRAENTCSDVGLLDDMSVYITDLVALLPTPPLPTLADMTEEGRKACQWMQADVEHRGRAVVIVPEWGAGHAELLNRGGSVFYAAHDSVTPRPDLPRMTWPGDKTPTPAPALPEGWRLADHQKHGRGIVTNPTPNRDGFIYCVAPSGRGGTGFDWYYCDPAELTYLDQEADQ